MIDRAALRIAPAMIVALLLSACGSDRPDGELMRRVAAAEDAAARAEAAQGKAEQAAADASNAAVVQEAEPADDEAMLDDEDSKDFDPDSQAFDNEIVAAPLPMAPPAAA